MGEFLKNLIDFKESSSRIELNEVFYCNTSEKNRRLFLHLNTNLVKDLNGVRLLNFAKDAIQKMVDNLKNNKSLENIEKITARSWIVRDHPGIFLKFGFHIETDSPDWANISKKDFLEKFNK